MDEVIVYFVVGGQSKITIACVIDEGYSLDLAGWLACKHAESYGHIPVQTIPQKAFTLQAHMRD